MPSNPLITPTGSLQPPAGSFFIALCPSEEAGSRGGARFHPNVWFPLQRHMWSLFWEVWLTRTNNQPHEKWISQAAVLGNTLSLHLKQEVSKQEVNHWTLTLRYAWRADFCCHVGLCLWVGWQIRISRQDNVSWMFQLRLPYNMSDVYSCRSP